MKNKSNSLTKYWSGQQFIGLSVFDSKENDCGKIQSLCIDIQTFSISGVMVKKEIIFRVFLICQLFCETSIMSKMWKIIISEPKSVFSLW